MTSLGSIAYTRLAPSWQARTAMMPGPVPISMTTAPGRIAPRRAWVYAPMRFRSAIIDPKLLRLYGSLLMDEAVYQAPPTATIGFAETFGVREKRREI